MSEIIVTSQAPKAIGPYSQAVLHQGMAFLSGQIPLDPATGQIVPGGIAEQTEQVIQNLSAVLEACGMTLANVVKTTVFVKDLENFAAMNEVYARHFGAKPPARSTVQAARLPRDVEVEIDAIAIG